MSTQAGRRGPEGGFTVAEVLVTLLLGLLLGSLVLGTLARVRTVLESMGRRGEALEAVRTARHVLAWEFRVGRGPGEAAILEADTLGLRAYRGVGWVCPGAPVGSTLVVVGDGVRSPDPEKDSVRVVTAHGSEATLALLDVSAPAACPALAAEGARSWRLSGEPPLGAVLALYFERGSYHFSGSALRYRRGGAGRQPLTAEVLSVPPSRFEGWHGGTAARLQARLFPGTARGVVAGGTAGAGTGR